MKTRAVDDKWKMALYAVSLSEAASRLEGSSAKLGRFNMGGHNLEFIGATVMRALSIETMLKAYQAISTGEHIEGHKLNVLYEHLPAPTKEAFTKVYAEKNGSDLIKCLEDHQNAFVEWRYVWENEDVSVHSKNLRDFGLILEEWLLVYIEKRSKGEL